MTEIEKLGASPELLREHAAVLKENGLSSFALTMEESADAIESLLAALKGAEGVVNCFRNVDDGDWHYLLGGLGSGGRGRFWNAVFEELRAALASNSGGGA